MTREVNEGADFWRDRPVLVTGAGGLLGGWLVRRLLDAGARMVCLVRERVPHSGVVTETMLKRATLVRGDIGDRGLLRETLTRHGIDTVFHTAAQALVGAAMRDPETTLRTNVMGTGSLLEACRVIGGVGQIVVTSSDKAYGHQPVLPYREDMALRPRHPYEVSKAGADLVAQTYARYLGLPVTITRCGNFFGGGDLNWNRIVPSTVRSLHRDEPPVIRSDGLHVRDYLYADDAAAAHLLLARRLAADRSLAGEVFNFSHEVRLTVKEMVALISRLMGASLTPTILNEAGDEIREQYLSAERARVRLGWTPGHTLEEGLKETIAWYVRLLSSGGGGADGGSQSGRNI